MSGTQAINVGDIRVDGDGTLIIGSNNTVVRDFARSFELITALLVDDKRRQIRHLWSMGAPEWQYFARRWNDAEDVPRKLYYDLFTRITNPPNPYQPYLQLILAASGWGKTILLMRLAADLSRQPNYTVLWLRPTASDAVNTFMPQVREVAQKLGSGRKLFVLIDDFLSVNKIGLFLQELLNVAGEAAQIIMVGSGQVGDLENTYSQPYDIHQIVASFVANAEQSDLLLAPFDDDELRQLVMLLRQKQVLFSGVPPNLDWSGGVLNVLGGPLTPPLTAAEYATMYQPRQAMSLLTRGELIKERIARKIGELQGAGDYRQPAQRSAMVRLYDEVILLHRISVPASRAWLEAAAQRDPQLKSALDAVISGQYQAAGVMQPQVDGSVTAAHPLDAQAAYELLNPNESDKRRAYAGLLSVAPLGVQGDALKMLHGLLGSSQSAAYGQNVALVQGVLADSAGKVQQLISTANPYQLGSGWAGLYRRIGDLPQALQMGTQAISRGGLAQDVGPAYYNRAIAQQQVGRVAEAARDFAEAGRIALLPPNTYIPPLQVAPPPSNGGANVAAVAGGGGLGIVAQVLIGVLLVILLGGGGFFVWQAAQGRSDGGNGGLEGQATATPNVEAVVTDTPLPNATDTPLPGSTDTPLVFSNAELLKRGVAGMRRAQGYSLEYNVVNGGVTSSINADVDIANQRRRLSYNDSQQQYTLISIGSDSYISRDGGQTYSRDDGQQPASSTLDGVVNVWDNFSDAAIERAAAALKDGDPPNFSIEGAATKHMIVPVGAFLLATRGVDSAQVNGTIEFWVTTATPYQVRQIQVIVSDGAQVSTVRWRNIDGKFDIQAPPGAAAMEYTRSDCVACATRPALAPGGRRVAQATF